MGVRGGGMQKDKEGSITEWLVGGGITNVGIRVWQEALLRQKFFGYGTTLIW